MRRNDQHLYDEYAGNVWNNSLKFQRMLAQQVEPRLEYFDRVTTEWRGVEVLDLGCGGGYMSEALARRGARVIGVDPCRALLDSAASHARSETLSIEYREGVGEAIPLGDASADRVVCVDVLEHVCDPRKVIAEIRRVLRPGGIFYFDTINRTRMAAFMVVTLMEDVFRIIPRGAHDPVKFIPPAELCGILKDNGFQEIGPFSGLGIGGFTRRLEPRIVLTGSTRVMYIGYAR